MTEKAMTIERGTIYHGGGRPYERTEARDITIQFRRHAQFAEAIVITYTRKGTRKRLEWTAFGGKLVILEGWGHPPPPGIWDQGASVLSISDRRTGVAVNAHVSRNCLGDGSWDAEFDEFLETYLARSGAQIAADYREHDFKDDHGPHLSWRELTPDMQVIVWGVENGEIIPPENWRIDPRWGQVTPHQEFRDLAEAQRVFADLDLNGSSKRFNGPMVDKKNGQFWTRFETWAVYNSLSD